MTNDLISREALLAELAEEIEWERAQMAPITAISAFKIAIRRVKKAPAVDAEPVRHGFWKNRGNHLQCNKSCATLPLLMQMRDVITPQMLTEHQRKL